MGSTIKSWLARPPDDDETQNTQATSSRPNWNHLHFSFAENAKRRAGHLSKHEKPWFRTLISPIVPTLLRKAGEAQGTGRRPREVILSDIDRHVRSIATLLDERSFLVATHLCAADISVFVELDAIKVAGLGAEIIGRYSRLVEWMARIDEMTDD